MPIYMKYGNIKGEVKAKGHEGWIELSSAQFGVKQNITARSGGANREAATPKISEIVITKVQDASSTDLFRESLQGQGTEVQIDFVNSQEDPINPYLTLKLKNTLISSYSVGGHSGGGAQPPMESLTLNFTSIEHGVGGTKNMKPQAPPPDTLRWDLDKRQGS